MAERRSERQSLEREGEGKKDKISSNFLSWEEKKV